MNTNTVSSTNQPVDNLQGVLAETLRSFQQVSGEALEAGRKGVKSAVEFAQEQIPDVIAQLMAWEFMYHLCWALAGVGFMAIVFVIFAAILKRVKIVGDSDDVFFTFVIGVAISLIVCVFTLGGSVIPNSLVCLKIKTAPKVFLIEYCNDILKPYNRTHSH